MLVASKNRKKFQPIYEQEQCFEMRNQNGSSEEIMKEADAYTTPLNEICLQTKIIALDSFEDCNAKINALAHTRYISNKFDNVL